MENMKEYWNNIYETKTTDQESWTQVVPKTSLRFIHSFHLPKDAKIIDIGGGDNKLVDFLISEGYENITVLDISFKALQRTKERLGDRAKNVKWIVSDINHFVPDETYDLWHDRACFHFLTDEEQIKRYIETVQKSVNGYLVLGTFSQNGPAKCSGLNVMRYDETTLLNAFQNAFDKIRCITEDHLTPAGKLQNFIFCGFKKK
ncbi:MAG: class I SAM-dependent methyltransferase [Chitinophagaceae bacterium]|nr:class I SAM-dependent methyltransferase [Chitinophagaceae bacterium]